jgi:tetraacyldisaccharide-1-P 4'-kinase
VREHLRYPDHHKFALGELQDAERKARACGAEVILITEKDSVRLPPGADKLNIPVAMIEVSIHVEEGLGVLDHMLESLLASGQGKSA